MKQVYEVVSGLLQVDGDKCLCVQGMSIAEGDAYCGRRCAAFELTKRNVVLHCCKRVIRIEESANE